MTIGNVLQILYLMRQKHVAKFWLDEIVEMTQSLDVFLRDTYLLIKKIVIVFNIIILENIFIFINKLMLKFIGINIFFCHFSKGFFIVSERYLLSFGDLISVYFQCVLNLVLFSRFVLVFFRMMSC